MTKVYGTCVCATQKSCGDRERPVATTGVFHPCGNCEWPAYPGTCSHHHQEWKFNKWEEGCGKCECKADFEVDESDCDAATQSYRITDEFPCGE
jgi:hypothetical protein